jgi:hypothetical protein
VDSSQNPSARSGIRVNSACFDAKKKGNVDLASLELLLDKKLDAFARRLEIDVGKLVDMKVAALNNTRDINNGLEALDRPCSQRPKAAARGKDKINYDDQTIGKVVPESHPVSDFPSGCLASSVTGPPLKITTGNSVPLLRVNESSLYTSQSNRGSASSELLQGLLQERLKAGPIDLHSYLDFESDPLPTRKTLPTAGVTVMTDNLT